MNSDDRDAGTSNPASTHPPALPTAQSASGQPSPASQPMPTVPPPPVSPRNPDAADALSEASEHAPRVTPPPPLPVAGPAGPLATRFKTPPVLVATAEPALTRMLSFALEQLRLPYRLLDSGPVALRELLEMPVSGQPPIVLLDVDLPGVDGLAILERIGFQRPDAFLILVLSSHADESVQVRSLLAGAVDHLAKPFNVRVLMAKVQRWTAMSAHLAGAA